MSQCPHHDVVYKTKLPTELDSRLVGESPECLVAFRRELAIALLRRHPSAKDRSGRQRSDYVYMYLAMDGVIGVMNVLGAPQMASGATMVDIGLEGTSGGMLDWYKFRPSIPVIDPTDVM